MTETITLTGTPGTNSVTYSALAYSNVLKVKREGVGYNIIISGTPSSREVLYTASSGTLTFSNAFAGSLSFDTGSETIYILYKG